VYNLESVIYMMYSKYRNILKLTPSDALPRADYSRTQEVLDIMYQHSDAKRRCILLKRYLFSVSVSDFLSAFIPCLTERQLLTSGSIGKYRQTVSCQYIFNENETTH